jgi:hypothetical protein
MSDVYREVDTGSKIATETAKKRDEIERDLAVLINKYSLENDCNTPDFIIAQYLYNCLINLHSFQGCRSLWYNPNCEGGDDWRTVKDPRTNI